MLDKEQNKKLKRVKARASTYNAERKKIIDQIIAYSKKRLSAQSFSLLKAFMGQYFANIPLEDLQARTIADLYGSVLSHWDLMYKRAPNEYKKRIFNPQFEIDGWQTSHTVLEFILEDQPFLVDTIIMEINRRGLTNHLVIHLGGIKVRRNDQHEIIEVLPHNADAEDAIKEAPIYLEIDRQTDPKVLVELGEALDRVIDDAQMAVIDWAAMRQEMLSAVDELEQTKAPLDQHELKESVAFLRWLLSDHYTFLGYRNYKVKNENGDKSLRLVKGSGLGVLRDESGSKVTRYYSELPEEARKLALSKQILMISKTNTRSTTHSPRYTDLVTIKNFNNEGEIIGERRFIGLYTSSAYYSSAQTIPVVRLKVAQVLERSGFPYRGHAAKTLLHILETLPRDDLFQATVDELYELAMGIQQLQDRRRIRLFMRKDAFGRFISCLVYIPRDNVNTELLHKMQDILQDTFNALEISFTTNFSDSILARIHYIVRIDSKKQPVYDDKEVEKKLIEVGRSWKDDLQENLLEFFGEEKGNELIIKYRRAFQAGYRETFSPRSAIFDIEHMERLSEQNTLEMSFYRPLGAAGNTIRFKLFRANATIPLSDALPILENLGLRVIGEQPHEIIFKDENHIWINDFNMIYPKETVLSVEINKQIFQDAFYKIWNGEAENDGFNHLVLSAQLNWREITAIRAYAKYLRQIGFTFSQKYMEEALAANPEVVKLLTSLFKYRFDPTEQAQSEQNTIALEEQINQALDSVANLDEDRILRMFLNLIKATLRTNFYQVDSQNNPKSYLSFKFNPQEIPELPLPKPMFEIFVYSPRFEGIHLRAGKVARGGIRWSDRREDFRTEVLGLMRAQQVKNAVIVPSGAKGGFVAKCLSADASREVIMEEGISCYKNFIRGLLDLTDNLQGSEVIHPQNTVRYDSFDPYLVVAADKGTATFSDIANNIAKEYGFWLGDAFASGGSAGYDHKGMGITARGAWESVKEHFCHRNIDIHTDSFTVVGIGDMAGDVFGNGMLLSENIKLIGAFNHQHIFLDPNPDPKISFQERKRLFNLPRSSWEDYNPELISKGGGVYKRSAKAIRLSPEIKVAIGITKDIVIPNELIRCLLKAPVDLLWNGGIGTFVKASHESHADAGDRANDGIRVNGNELQCKVVAEGGNLGLTQRARIEYETNGGRLNTDFIDNSGGVDCSDHEVNIKILLNGIVAAGDMTEKQRNQLLAGMTNEVAQLVLYNNYRQARAISITVKQSIEYLGLYDRYLDTLDKEGILNREFENLPDNRTIIERKAAGKGFTRPEIAVLSAYSKIWLKEDLLKSSFIDNAYLAKYVSFAFPKVLRKQFASQLLEHRLYREIIATQLSNSIITDMGVTFVYQMQDETRSSPQEIVRAYTIATGVFSLHQFWADVESLDYKIDTEVQLQMTQEVIRLIRRATRWFLRNMRQYQDIKQTIELFLPKVQKISTSLSGLVVGADKDYLEHRTTELVAASVPEAIAQKVASTRALYSSLNIIEAATEHNIDFSSVTAIYFQLANLLDLDQFREMINTYRVDSHWSVSARAVAKGDLDWQQRMLTIGVLKNAIDPSDAEGTVKAWHEKNKHLVERWYAILSDLRSANTTEYAMLAVAIRELLDLAQASFTSSPIGTTA